MVTGSPLPVLFAQAASWLVARLHESGDLMHDGIGRGSAALSRRTHSFSSRPVSLPGAAPPAAMHPMESELAMYVKLWCWAVFVSASHTQTVSELLIDLVLCMGSSLQGLLLTVSGLDITHVFVSYNRFKDKEIQFYCGAFQVL